MNKLIQHRWGQYSAEILGLRPDLVFADPPYNIGIEYPDDPTHDLVDPGVYYGMLEYCIKNVGVIMAPTATVWFMVPEQHADVVGPMLTKYIGPRLYRIVWHEAFSQYQDHTLTMDYRFIFVHARNDHPYYLLNPDLIRVESVRQQMGDKRANSSGRLPGQVWTIRRLQGTANDRVLGHSTQLPPELMDRILHGWTNPGDTVMDCFAGFGSLLKRAKLNDRKWIGVDQSKTCIEYLRGVLA